MGVKSASGMEFTPERLRSTYHNVGRVYNSKAGGKKYESDIRRNELITESDYR